ncbi:MAG: cysteine-rich CWC family protein [Gallionella sp.]|nr:cysteine-rich CWC family protein [Gallionella sp.]
MNTKPNCICPLCGKPNECALAQSGSAETPCWCHNVEIDPSAMARIPEAQRGESCICRKCASLRLNPNTENN